MKWSNAGVMAVLLVAAAGCVSVTANRSANGDQSIVVKSFLENVNGGEFSCTDANEQPMSLKVETATPDQQSIALLSAGVVDLGKQAMALAAKSTTNAAAAETSK